MMPKMEMHLQLHMGFVVSIFTLHFKLMQRLAKHQFVSEKNVASPGHSFCEEICQSILGGDMRKMDSSK